MRRELELTAAEQQEARGKADLKAEEVWGNYAELYKKSDMETYVSSGMGKKIQDETNQTLQAI
ncbi:hypothetical protein, partial [Psychrobacter celer]|uniref:hypothetical protein n=1 Tax=Psychrobacter celer TaxID=306572 RepID=UPI003FD0F217